MSAGSDNSNFGYKNLNPDGETVNSAFVNKWSSNNPMNFSSNEVTGLPGLTGAKSNVDAASGVVPGICLFKGGSKTLKKKIKNISKKYKNMKSGTKKMRSIKNKLNRLASKSVSIAGGKRRRRTRTHSKRSHRYHKQKGGYAQYQNNYPNTPVYSVGGVLNSSNLGVATPSPISVLPHCVNCIDNYNHFTGKGFPSPGH